MSFVKNTLDFFKRNVLRIRPQKDRQVIKAVPGFPVGSDPVNDRTEYFIRVGGDVKPDRPRAMPTYRTYSLGGDPFNDRIEFHLTDAGTSGFGDPVPEGEVRKPVRELTEDEIRAAFGCPSKRKY